VFGSSAVNAAGNPAFKVSLWFLRPRSSGALGRQGAGAGLQELGNTEPVRLGFVAAGRQCHSSPLRCLTLRSSGPPPAWHLAREAPQVIVPLRGPSAIPVPVRSAQTLGVMQEPSSVAEFVGLFQATLPTQLADRFCGLLQLKSDRWRNIDPTKILDYENSREILEWKQSVSELLTSRMFGAFSGRTVLVLHCGHATPKVDSCLLSEALSGPRSVLEGFISVLPGELGLAVDHEGTLCVLRK
jgi:hypothetical protein